MSGSDYTCALCKSSAALRCSGCAAVYYCSAEHQRKDWPLHRVGCRAYEVKMSSRGQYVVAARDLKAGDIIVTESPLVIAPRFYNSTPHAVGNTCVGCFRRANPNDLSASCRRCQWPACRFDCPGLTDEARHGGECTFLRATKIMQQGWSMLALMPLRCLLLQNRDPKKWKTISKMALPATKLPDVAMSDPELREALVFLKEGVLKVFSNAGPQYKLQAPLGTAQEIFAFLSAKSRNLESVNQVNPLTAIYAVGSILGHDCMPNTRLLYEDFDHGTDAKGARIDTWRGRVTIRATKDISKGDRLTSAFAERQLCTLDRQKILKGFRNTLCSCVRCMDPSELGLHTGTLRCLRCSGWVLPLNTAKIEDSYWRCVDCALTLDPSSVQQLLDGLVMESREANYDGCPTIPENEACLRRLESFLHPNHQLCVAQKGFLGRLYGAELYKPGLCDMEYLEKRRVLSEDVMKIMRTPILGFGEEEIGESIIEFGRANAEILKRHYLTGKWNRQRVEVAAAEVLSVYREARLQMPDYHPSRPEIFKRAAKEEEEITSWATKNGFNIAE